MEIYKDEIDRLLEEWGRRAREQTTKIGYPSNILGRLKGSTVKSASITDEDYLTIDEAVSSLIINNQMLYDVAGYIYIQNKSYKQIGKKIGRCERTVCSYRQTIIDIVSSYLNHTN